MIDYRNGPILSEADVVSLYSDAGWTEYLKDKAKLLRGISRSLELMAAYDKETKKLVGLIRVLGDGETAILVQDLLVRKDYQGRGIGQELLKRVMDKYRDVRQKIAICDADKGLEAFYRQCGFAEISEAQGSCFVKFL
jgi:GNAT superfamily N-acetyltransferase